MATKPSIALIPSGYKASTLYSVLPSNGDADLTTSRGSEATRVNKDGLIETVASNIPRLDYSNGGCPSYLIEPQSTNLITNSQDINASSWDKQNLTVNTDNTISPAATQTADKVLENNVDSSHLFYQEVAANGNDTYNFSVFVKKLNRRYVGIQGFYNNVRGSIAFYDLDEGILVYTNQFGSGYSINDAKIEEYSDGWYRLSANITSPDSIHYLGLCLADDNWGSGTAYTNTYQGDVTKGVYIWGAQVEALSYSTSYIKTEGSTSTRLAETASKDNLSDHINSSEGVLYAEVLTKNGFVSISDGSSGNRITFGEEGGNRVVITANNGSLQNYISLGVWDEAFVKIAIRYSLSNLKIYINGINVDSRNTFNLPLNLSRLGFDSGVGTSNFYGKVKDLRVYNTVLTDQELQQLTS